MLLLVGCFEVTGFFFFWQGEWILNKEDSEQANVLLFMYKIKCENIGFSKDALLTQTFNFALLFGSELDQEVRERGRNMRMQDYQMPITLGNSFLMQVLSMTMDLFVARTMTTKASLEFCGPMNLCVKQVGHAELMIDVAEGI